MQRLIYISKVLSSLALTGSKSSGKSILHLHFGQAGFFSFSMRSDQQPKHARPLQEPHMLSLTEFLSTPFEPRVNFGIGKF